MNDHHSAECHPYELYNSVIHYANPAIIVNDCQCTGDDSDNYVSFVNESNDQDFDDPVFCCNCNGRERDNDIWSTTHSSRSRMPVIEAVNQTDATYVDHKQSFEEFLRESIENSLPIVYGTALRSK